MSNKVFVKVGVDGRNIPAGGVEGQVLVKASSDSYDFKWATVDGVNPDTATPATNISPRDTWDRHNSTTDKNGVLGTSSNYAREDHSHPFNVPTSGTPEMDGDEAKISNNGSTYYAAFDHVHPHDTNRASASELSTLQTTVSNLAAMFSGFTVTLATTWTDNEQTVEDAKFIASGYAYIITPDGDSRDEYASCGIYADKVETDGEITFHCESAPSALLTVNVVRVPA